MSKILSMNKHAISTALIIILGLVATACNAVPGVAINPITVINTPLNNAQLKEGDLSLAEDVKVLPAKSVLPHHFWLGIQSQPADGRTRASQSSAGQSRSQRRR